MKLYCRLATANIKNNRQFYLPYLLTGIISMAMFYLVVAMQDNPGLRDVPGGADVKGILTFGIGVVGVFVSVFLFYTNSFIIKRRKKELGVYNILGMEKKHFAKVLFLEMSFVVMVTITGGLLFGIVFNKLVAMILYKLANLSVSIPFTVSITGCVYVLKLFLAIYAATFLYNLMQIKLANPIALLHGSRTGEREPKTKILLVAVGVLTLGCGYYIALTTTNAMQAITLFFVAVLLVIIGTYCLFTAGSIAFLKFLRRNKKYYYQTKHFTTVSGMLYRMKQNAVGLANICILSTMVLVTVSTTISMYLGVEDALDVRNPMEVVVTAYYQEMPQKEDLPDVVIADSLKNSGRVITGRYGYLNLSTTAVRRGNGFSVTGIGSGTDYSISDVAVVEIMTEADYEAYMGTQIADLGAGEVAVSAVPEFEGETMTLEGQAYKVKEICPYPEKEKGYLAAIANGSAYIIVPDEAALAQIFQKLGQNWDQVRTKLEYQYDMGFDIDGTGEEKLAAEAAVHRAVAEWERSGADRSGCTGVYIDARQENRASYYSLYGSMFFLGMFLGTLFLMVTVLIIFYKQMSEGYEDKERYAIMEKVGMSNDEVKRTIRSQVLTVFFLPIVAAVVHAAMAFPMIVKLLGAMALTNTALFAVCVAGTALVFFIIYLLVFLLTSRSYYKIVGNQV